MFVDLDISQGEWFDFRMSNIDPNTGEVVWGEPVEGVGVCIRSMKPFFEERINKREKIVEWKINPKTRANEKHVNFKDLTPEEAQSERDDAFDYAIVGWEGFNFKVSRQPIECIRVNKLAMMKKDFFDRFFADCQQKIDTLGIEIEQKVAENLSKPQNG